MQVQTPKLRLRTILLIVSLTVLILPLGSIFFFRIYENSLVRQTESELISQAAFIASIYKGEINDLIKKPNNYGIVQENTLHPSTNNYYTPIKARIDLSENELLPRRPDGIAPKTKADQTAIIVGKKISKIMKSAQRITLSGMKVLDYNGVSIAGQKEINLSFIHLEEVKSALSGKYTSVIRERISDNPPPAISSISREANIRIFIAMPIIYKDRVWGVVYLSRTPENILHHLHDEKEKVILAGISILLITLFLALFISYTISKPIHQLIKKTKNVSTGDEHIIQQIKSPVTKEIALLSKSFSEMSMTLHKRSEYIKNFAAHVSHEFKTPLTSMQGAAELLLEHYEGMSTSERELFTSNIIQDINRLKRLVTRLLELARADNVSVSDEVINISELLNNIQQKYITDGLAIFIEGDVEINIKISSDNFEEIVTNIIENSKQHKAAKVTIIAEQIGRDLIMKFIDNGEGISTANREKIFTPFFTTKRDNGGTGLGLGIVKSLIKSHGGSITLGNSNDGTEFTLSFKIDGLFI